MIFLYRHQFESYLSSDSRSTTAGDGNSGDWTSRRLRIVAAIGPTPPAQLKALLAPAAAAAAAAAADPANVCRSFWESLTVFPVVYVWSARLSTVLVANERRCAPSRDVRNNRSPAYRDAMVLTRTRSISLQRPFHSVFDPSIYSSVWRVTVVKFGIDAATRQYWLSLGRRWRCPQYLPSWKITIPPADRIHRNSMSSAAWS